MKAEGEAETDKATMEFEAYTNGVMGKITTPAGERVDVDLH